MRLRYNFTYAKRKYLTNHKILSIYLSYFFGWKKIPQIVFSFFFQFFYFVDALQYKRNQVKKIHLDSLLREVSIENDQIM